MLHLYGFQVSFLDTNLRKTRKPRFCARDEHRAKLLKKQNYEKHIYQRLKNSDAEAMLFNLLLFSAKRITSNHLPFILSHKPPAARYVPLPPNHVERASRHRCSYTRLGFHQSLRHLYGILRLRFARFGRLR